MKKKVRKKKTTMEINAKERQRMRKMKITRSVKEKVDDPN